MTMEHEGVFHGGPPLFSDDYARHLMRDPESTLAPALAKLGGAARTSRSRMTPPTRQLDLVEIADGGEEVARGGHGDGRPEGREHIEGGLEAHLECGEAVALDGRQARRVDGGEAGLEAREGEQRGDQVRARQCPRCGSE